MPRAIVHKLASCAFREFAGCETIVKAVAFEKPTCKLQEQSLHVIVSIPTKTQTSNRQRRSVGKVVT